MRSGLSSELLMRLLNATPEQYAAVEKILGANAEPETRSAEWGRPVDAVRNRFRKSGSHWDVIHEGGQPFHLPDMMGAEYLNYLLHHPNQPIRAFDLEVAIRPEKGQVREANSVQKSVDSRARREALAELRALRSELEEAEANDEASRIERLRGEIRDMAAVAMTDRLLDGDTGERARDNVRKTIGKILHKLRKGGPEEQAFARHLHQSIALGYEVIYHQPAGRVWA